MPDKCLTATQLARRVCRENGVKQVTPDFLEYLIWERTGWPCFWQTKNPVKEMRGQLEMAVRDLPASASATAASGNQGGE